jgi:mannose-6-phosphate isomerase-like protein (cupin superfamily)
MTESYASSAVAETGDTLSFPDGSDYTITASTLETDGKFFEMELTLPPGVIAPPPHVHPVQEEDYEVLAGTLDVLLDGSWRSLSAGESMRVPAGSPHTFGNSSGGTVRVRNTHRPALQFQYYFEKLHELVTSGKVTSFKNFSSLIYMSLLWEQHEREIVAARAPQRAVMSVLARAGRRLGYRLP